MDSFVQIIVNGSSEFTPDMLIRLFGFMMVMDMVGNVIASAFKAGRM